jgi:hypothetical protein
MLTYDFTSEGQAAALPPEGTWPATVEAVSISENQKEAWGSFRFRVNVNGVEYTMAKLAVTAAEPDSAHAPRMSEGKGLVMLLAEAAGVDVASLKSAQAIEAALIGTACRIEVKRKVKSGVPLAEVKKLYLPEAAPAPVVAAVKK